ncbi:hypothetical protein, partial [Pseudomonas aeruginosa]|uniref:hypothetical protein n=1 Tax=Pseudomonas aeruginosa TaxID=287 RepID=UPI0035BBF81A
SWLVARVGPRAGRPRRPNPAKLPPYAPGRAGRQVAFAGLDAAGEAAVGGRAPAGLPAWLSEDC